MATKTRYVTVKEAAATLDVSPNTVRAWGAAGKLPEYRHPVNNYRLFKQSDVNELKALIAKPILRATSGEAKRRTPK